jgi:hypothetical protein
MRNKGTGIPVTRREKEAYKRLRAAGMSPEAAAEVIGRSKSWAYQYEKQIHNANRVEPRGNGYRHPSPDFTDAVEFIIGFSHDDPDKALPILERYGSELIFRVADVAMYFARVQAIDNHDKLHGLLEAFEETDALEEIQRNPVSAEELLRAFPTMIEMRDRGIDVGSDWNWQPARVRTWLKRLERHPDLREIADEVDAAARSEDPQAALKRLRESIGSETEEANG